MIDSSSLRLSAQRALLNRITPTMRLIKVEIVGDDINLSCFTDQPPDPTTKDAISDAGGEIIADFPDANIIELVRQHHGKLPTEDIIAHGWVYARYEASVY